MDKVLVDGVPLFNHWTSANDIIHKRWSLNDTKNSSLQQELNSSLYPQHPEETKSGSQPVKRIPHLGSIVSERKAFFESHMKLPVPVTKEQAKCVRIPATLKVCNPKTAGTSIVESVQGPRHLSKEKAVVITTKTQECNRFCPVQEHPVGEKRRQLIGLYQAICEKVRQSPYDLRQNISKDGKEKASPTLQDRLRCLLIEESNNQEEKELRSKRQNLEQNDHSVDSLSESHLTGHLSLRPFKKHQRAEFPDPESAVNHKGTVSIPRASEIGNSRQRSLPLDKAHGRSDLNSTANNESQQNHRDIFSRTVWENPVNEHCLTLPANQDSATGKPANSEIANKLTAACWPTDSATGSQSDVRIGFPTHFTASKACLALQEKINSLHRSANQSASPLAKCCQVERDQEPEGKVCSKKMPLNELLLQEVPQLNSVLFPASPVKTAIINQTCKQQKRPAASRLWSTADIDCLEKRPSQSDLSLVLCSPQKQKTKSLSHLEVMNSETVADDDIIQSQSDSSTKDSKAKIQFKSIPLTKLNDDGAQEVDSSCLSSLAQASSSDFEPSGSTTMSQVEEIRQHLQSLEADYQELVALLSRHSRTVPVHRKLKQKGQNTVKHGKLWAQLKLQRQKDIWYLSKEKTDETNRKNTVQRRFAHLEAHVLLLVRNIAHLTEEIGSQNSLLQKIHSFQLEIKKTQQACNKEIGDPNRLSIKQDSSSTSECSLYCGERPSMMTIFLKKLGYEHYTPLFENAGIGFTELPYLDEESLEKLGIPMGPRLHILREIRCTTYV